MKFSVLILSVCLSLSACGSGSNEGSTPNALDNQNALDDQSQFLVANANRDGVTVTASGLQYEVITAAQGLKPSSDDAVTVHYTGTLVDGREFDSSYKRGQSATFVLSGTIPGWVEGVQLMSVGSTYRFVIPPELAYGERGAGELIKPNAVLIFVVELLEINSA